MLAECTVECTRTWTRTCNNPTPEGDGADCASDDVGESSGTDLCTDNQGSCNGMF